MAAMTVSDLIGVPARPGLADRRRLAAVTIAAVELTLLVLVLDLYDVVAPRGSADAVGAVAHARSEWALEGGWGLAVERGWYDALASHSLVASLANGYYTESIYLVPAVVAILLVVADVDRYRAMRSIFVGSTLVAYAVFCLYPVAPPCLLPGSAMPCGQLPPPDPFAAMPSLHVAWASVSAFGLMLLSRRWWVRGLGAAHVMLTIIVVVATGHHFVLDTLAGLAVVALVAVIAPPWVTSLFPAPVTPPPAAPSPPPSAAPVGRRTAEPVSPAGSPPVPVGSPGR